MDSFEFSPDDSAHRAFVLLSQSRAFHSLRLTCNNDSLEYLPSAKFTHLRSLVLQGMPHYGYNGEGSDTSSIAAMLAASPLLRELALSEHNEISNQQEQHGLLYELCSTFEKLRFKNKNIRKLKLQRLDLGRGYCPLSDWFTDSSGSGYAEFKNDSYERDCLSQLTDVHFLQEFILDNSIRKDWHNYQDRRHAFEDWSILAAAINLRRLTVHRLTSGVVDFVADIRDANPAALTEIAGIGEDEDNSTDSMSQGQDIFEGEAIFAFPVDKLADIGGWKRVEIGNRSCDLQRELFGSRGKFELYCAGKDTEELTYAMPKQELEYFKHAVLPKMEGLKILMIPSSKGAFVLSERQSAIRRRFGLPKTEILNAVQREEDTRLALAEELFGISYAAWEARGQKGEKLSRVGLGSRLYTFLYPVLGEMGQGVLGKKRAVRICREEASKYEAIRRFEVERFNNTNQLE